MSDWYKRYIGTTFNTFSPFTINPIITIEKGNKMEKLLHERLREYAVSEDGCMYIGSKRLVLTNREAETLADEIERDYTPRQKVYDADGVEIKVGDTVWRIDPPIQPSEVIDIKHYPEGQPDVVCSEKDGKVTAHYSPRLLTHKEPDSLEKLLDEIEGYAGLPLDTIASVCSKRWAKRLSDLIERGAWCYCELKRADSKQDIDEWLDVLYKVIRRSNNG